MENEKVIGERYTIPFQKSVITAGVLLAIIGVLFLVVSFLEDSNYDSALALLVAAIMMWVLAVIMIVIEVIDYKRRKKRETVPTIVLVDMTNLRLTKRNGKEIVVALTDIQNFKTRQRIGVRPGLFFNHFEKCDDGNVTFYLKDNSKVKVTEVAELENVRQQLLSLDSQEK